MKMDKFNFNFKFLNRHNYKIRREALSCFNFGYKLTLQFFCKFEFI